MSEPAKDAMELVHRLRTGRVYPGSPYSIFGQPAVEFAPNDDEAVALIQSSFEAWARNNTQKIIEHCAALAVSYMQDTDDWSGTVSDCGHLRNAIINGDYSTLASRQSAVQPSGELYALIDQLCKLGNGDADGNSDGNSDGNRIAQKARALLASRQSASEPSAEEVERIYRDLFSAYNAKHGDCEAKAKTIIRALLSHESPKEQA